MVSDSQAIRDALVVLEDRATTVRSLFAAWERQTYGREWSTSDLMAGFIVDVGDLTRLVMAAEGVRQIDNVEESLAHELADCLWSVLVLAGRLNVDLGQAFATTMDDLESKLRP